MRVAAWVRGPCVGIDAPCDAGLRGHGWLCDPRRCCQPSGRDPRYLAMCGLPPGPPASRRCRPAARREFVLGHRRICPRRSARSCPRSCPRHTAALWPRSAPRAPPRSRTTAVGTGSHLEFRIIWNCTKYGCIYVMRCQDDKRQSVPHSEAHDATATARYPMPNERPHPRNDYEYSCS